AANGVVSPVLEKERRERHDQDEAGKDEREPADEGAPEAGGDARAEDRELSRGGTGEQACRRHRVLELAWREPMLALDHHLPQERRVRLRPADAARAEPPPAH